MISMRMKKFYKKTGRKLQFDAKEAVGFDKTKVECYNCHKTGHFARECRFKGTQDNRRRDAWNSGNKDGSRTGQKEDSKALVTVDGEGVDWTNHSEEEELCFDGLQQLRLRNKESDFRKPTLNDSLGRRNACCTPTTEGNYMPTGPEIEIDYSQFTYGPKQTQPSESESQSSACDTCESNISTEPSELVSEPVVIESNVESQSKVWSDAPIIEEYESDSDDECVVIPTKQQETPSFANQQVKTPRENVKSQNTHSQKPKVDKKELGHGFADYPHRALKNKGIVDSGCSRHMTGNKAYLENSNFNGGPVAMESKPIKSKGYKTIRSDNGTKFKNKEVIEFCGIKGIKREYSNARTLQQNGVAERKNRTLIEAARTMLADSFLPNTFWAEAVRKGPTWLFDLDYLTDSMNYHPVSSENEANLHAGQQEANQNAVMKSRFQMSSMGELTFFLGLQVKQKEDGIFISQDKYLKGKPKLGLWYPRVSSFDLESYSDSDYAGANIDRKSTTGGYQFLGRRLISGSAKVSVLALTRSQYLEQSEGNEEFHEIIDFLKRSSIHFALTVSDQAKEIQDLKAKITKLKKQAKPVIKHHKAYLKSVSLKQRFPRKSFSKKHRVHKESKQRMLKMKGGQEGKSGLRQGDDEVKLSTEDEVSTIKEGVSTDFEKVSTDKPIVSTDGSKVSTDRKIKHKENFLATTKRSESIRNKPPTRINTEIKMKTNLKHEDERMIKRDEENGVDLSKRVEVIKEESKESVRRRLKKKDTKNRKLQDGNNELKLHSSSGIHTLVTDTGLVIHMLVEKKYPLRKEVLMQMLKLKLESEEENTMALELINVVQKILAEYVKKV
ncbi:ribonuclease H-like domain-containing protein [Tanacetum coccineum]